ncbi:MULTISPECIES: hypothetical protein [Rhizobium]|uniref:hypothetical protein n=1 Tax=Rhizobium TaxID=379 RepID=UPI00103AF56A|nr:hypothetical protein [Rhizobium leguminosarum]TBY83000.1 hypothetical protein E0H32_11425 [Rhizobium leguminosarum bv. viciae]UFW77936.1 hypothetical protein RlegSU303_22305 [Rhizobium leguminosarum bv. viciae]
MNVSRIVSRHVQSDVSPDAEIISAKKRNRKLKKRSSGLYLVRSGGIYLFQIRLPKRIGGGAGSRPIRVSLGALPHQEARELADALAALARTVFKEIEKRMAGYEGPDLSHIVSGLADEDIPADDWPFEFATLILKGGLFDLREPARAPTPEEAKGFEMMRGLVRIGREASALSNKKVELLLKTGVQSGLLDNAMLPLLGLLTGRRLGLLVHLQGIDFREKFEGVWVAQTGGIVYGDGIWRRVPYKTNASVSFFVLHNFLVEIGFPQWAKEQGGEFIFKELNRLADPSKSASSYMARLFERAGIKEVRQEVYHSLRSGFISASGDKGIETRDRKLQAGHELGADEHELYGFKTLTETKARQIAYMQLPDIDLSPYLGLDFDKLARAERTRGRKIKGA